MAETQQQGGEGEAKDKAAAVKGAVPVSSAVPEKAIGQINPSSPADTGTTPGSVAEIG